MDKLDELTTDVGTLTTTVGNLTSGVAALKETVANEDKAVQAAVAALGGTSEDPRVQALIDAVNTAQTNVGNAVQDLGTAAAQAQTDTASLNSATQQPPAGGDAGSGDQSQG